MIRSRAVELLILLFNITIIGFYIFNTSTSSKGLSAFFYTVATAKTNSDRNNGTASRILEKVIYFTFSHMLESYGDIPGEIPLPTPSKEASRIRTSLLRVIDLNFLSTSKIRFILHGGARGSCKGSCPQH